MGRPLPAVPGRHHAVRAHACALRAVPCIILVLAAMLGLAPGRANATLSAPIRADVPAGAAPAAVAIADLNDDQRPDLVVANEGSNTVSVLLGTADGYLPRTDYATGNAPSAVAVTDLNGDGHPDLVVADGRASTISVFLGAGGGSFQSRVAVTVGSGPTGIVAGDWNGDGHADLAVSCGISGAVYVLRGNGLGGFSSRRSVSIGSGLQGIAAGDLDGDGHTDLVVAVSGANQVVVLNGDAAGNFDYFDALSTPAFPRSVALGDLDGDGHLDAAVACADANAICVLRGDGSGSLPVRTDFAGGSGPSGIAIGDLNGDHHPDLIVTNPAPSIVTEMLGDGAGQFTFGLIAPMGTGCRSVVTASLNGDTLTDFVTANGGANSVSVCVGGGSAVLALTTSPNPALVGATVTLTATLVPLTLAGTITFFDGGTAIGTTTLVSGVAVMTTRTLTAGTHSLTASYAGGGGAGAATSPPVLQVVTTPLPTTTSLGIAPSPSTIGQPVVLTATVSPASATGIVDFDDGVTWLGSAYVVNGVAQRVVTNFAAGDHTLLAVYAGSDLFLGSRSDALPHHVSPGAVSVLVTSSANPATPGEALTFTVTVTAVPPATGVPGGTVQLEVDGAPVGPLTALFSGRASVGPVSNLALGAHLVDAVYGGTPGFTAGASPLILQMITQAPTTTTVTPSVNPAIAGQALTFRAVVAANPPYTVVPTGSVQFSVDGVDTGAPVALAGGAATSASMPGLAPGVHAVRASYSGSAACLSSTSGALDETVIPPCATIRSLRDVPADQGRLLRLLVARSPLDLQGAVPLVVRYSVFRRIDVAVPAAPAAASRPEGVQLAGWDQVASFDAYQDTLYSVLVPTLADSSAAGTHRSTYLVRAGTAQTGVYYDSPPDSGYSVDNLPPSSPAPFTAARLGGATHLHWGANGEPDFAVYRIYRGADPAFLPGPGSLIAQQPDTGYVDAGPAGGVYKLSAVDVNGDESAFAVASPGDAADPPGARLAFALEPVRPNPSTGPGLVVRFTLPAALPARLELLDVSGRRVVMRDAGSLGAGRHEVDLLAGTRAGAGLYFVRLSQAGASRMVRVALVR